MHQNTEHPVKVDSWRSNYFRSMIKKNLFKSSDCKNRVVIRFTKGKAVRKLLIALLFLSFAAFADDKSLPSTTAAQTTSSQSDLQNDKHYVNKDGQVVHSPTKTKSGQAPAGATAKCGDGTYSFSQHHQGTCSHHGGVASWL